MIDRRYEYIRNEIIFDLLKEVAKLSRTTDTSYVPPDVLELVNDFGDTMTNWETNKKIKNTINLTHKIDD